MGVLTTAGAAAMLAGALGALPGVLGVAVAGAVVGVAAGVLAVAVTGAGGYLGREVVRALLARGHRVRALLRSSDGPPGAEARRLDLACDPIGPAIEGCDAVVHAAGALAGSDALMARDSVEATRRLVAAVKEAGEADGRADGRAGTPRLVLASSLSVYAAGPPGGAITEDSALEPEPRRRDAYARAKLAQERLVREAGLADAWLLRIGHLWGPGRMDGSHLGPRLGSRAWSVRLRVAAGPLPLAHVAHAALACALACETPARGVEAVNVLDADLPDARRWLGLTRESAMPVPWRAVDAAAGILGRAPGLEEDAGPFGTRLPHLLRRPALRARTMPRAWPVDRLRDRLGWAPLGSFEEMARWTG